MKTAAQQLSKSHNRRHMFLGLIAGIVVSFVLYGFAITSTTLSIANADSHNNTVNDLQTEIAELEIEYFEIINTMSMEEAVTEGFNEISNIQFARIDESSSLAYNN